MYRISGCKLLPVQEVLTHFVLQVTCQKSVLTVKVEVGLGEAILGELYPVYSLIVQLEPTNKVSYETDAAVICTTKYAIAQCIGGGVQPECTVGTYKQSE